MARVLHVLAQKPAHTGSGVYLRALMDEAARRASEVAAVVGISSADPHPGEGLFTVNFDSERLPFPVVGMSDVMPYPSTRWNMLHEQQLQDVLKAFEDRVRAAIIDFEPDLVHCHHLWALTARVRKVVTDRPVVASCHGTGLRQAKNLPGLWQRFLPWISKLDHIFCLNREQLVECQAYDSPCTLVGAGFDASVFAGRNPERPQLPQVLFAGKLSYSKGCRELLQAFEPLKREGLAGLALAGSGFGSETECITELARHTGAQLLGRLGQKELAREMSRSEVFVLPSYYEGLPLVLAEALACGCRVVVNRLPGLQGWLPSDLVDSGWVRLVDMPALASVDDPQPSEIPAYVRRLQEALKAALEGPSEPPETIDSFLSDTSWKGVSDKIFQVYEELL